MILTSAFILTLIGQPQAQQLTFNGMPVSSTKYFPTATGGIFEIYTRDERFSSARRPILAVRLGTSPTIGLTPSLIGIFDAEESLRSKDAIYRMSKIERYSQLTIDDVNLWTGHRTGKVLDSYDRDYSENFDRALTRLHSDSKAFGLDLHKYTALSKKDKNPLLLEEPSNNSAIEHQNPYEGMKFLFELMSNQTNRESFTRILATYGMKGLSSDASITPTIEEKLIAQMQAMQAKLCEIESQNCTLQAEVKALQEQIKTKAAGDNSIEVQGAMAVLSADFVGPVSEDELERALKLKNLLEPNSNSGF